MDQQFVPAVRRIGIDRGVPLDHVELAGRVLRLCRVLRVPSVARPDLNTSGPLCEDRCGASEGEANQVAATIRSGIRFHEPIIDTVFLSVQDSGAERRKTGRTTWKFYNFVAGGWWLVALKNRTALRFWLTSGASWRELGTCVSDACHP